MMSKVRAEGAAGVSLRYVKTPEIVKASEWLRDYVRAGCRLQDAIRRAHEGLGACRENVGRYLEDSDLLPAIRECRNLQMVHFNVWNERISGWFEGEDYTLHTSFLNDTAVLISTVANRLYPMAAAKFRCDPAEACEAIGDKLARLVAVVEGSPLPDIEIYSEELDSEVIRADYFRAQLETQPQEGISTEESEAESKSPIRRPSERAMMAWRLRDLEGLTPQKEIAVRMTNEGVRATQGEVSRWLKQVEAYFNEGNSLTPLEPLTHQPQSISPDVIDMGQRQDGHTPRQRERRQEDEY